MIIIDITALCAIPCESDESIPESWPQTTFPDGSLSIPAIRIEPVFTVPHRLDSIIKIKGHPRSIKAWRDMLEIHNQPKGKQ